MTDEEYENLKNIFIDFIDEGMDRSILNQDYLKIQLATAMADKKRLEIENKKLSLKLYEMNMPLEFLGISDPNIGGSFNQDLMKYLGVLAQNGNKTAKKIVDSFATQKSIAAKKSANARHNQPGGSNDKQRKIKELWATGQYQSKNQCAEKVCNLLGMSNATARKALINEPVPKKD